MVKSPIQTPPPENSDARGRIDVLAIGASTGGPNALAELFAQLPANFPVPILVVQHMPPMFARLLAERLTKVSGISTAEAIGDREPSAPKPG